MASEALIKAPRAGDVWVDGIDHGCEWLIEAVSAETVYLVMLRDGKRTQSYREWPVNRWRAFLFRQGVET